MPSGRLKKTKEKHNSCWSQRKHPGIKDSIWVSICQQFIICLLIKESQWLSGMAWILHVFFELLMWIKWLIFCMKETLQRSWICKNTINTSTKPQFKPTSWSRCRQIECCILHGCFIRVCRDFHWFDD